MDNMDKVDKFVKVDIVDNVDWGDKVDKKGKVDKKNLNSDPYSWKSLDFFPKNKKNFTPGSRKILKFIHETRKFWISPLQQIFFLFFPLQCRQGGQSGH